MDGMCRFVVWALQTPDTQEGTLEYSKRVNNCTEFVQYIRTTPRNNMHVTPDRLYNLA